MGLLGTLGAIWGSFVGALSSRWPLGKSVAKGRSHCDNCGHVVVVQDLIPIVSFLILRGKCRFCRHPIAIDAFGLELVGALIGICSWLFMPAYLSCAGALFGWLLLPLIILDLKYLWLPDRLVVTLALAGVLIGPWLAPQIGFVDRLIGAVAGYAALEALRRVYLKFKNHEGMGQGDPKLFAALGLWLGWQSLPLLLLIASGTGLSMALAARQSSTGRMTAFPFGAYLGIGSILLIWL